MKQLSLSVLRRAETGALLAVTNSNPKRYLWRHPHGYWYVRFSGRYHRITAEAGTADFDSQYWQILDRGTVCEEHSVNALIESYRGSLRWSSLRPRTRSDYEKVLMYLADRFGGRRIKEIERKDLIAEMQSNRHRIRFANYISQVASVLYEHAQDIGWVQQNPAKGLRKLSVPTEKRKPHIPWPDWAVERFRAEACNLPRLIFELGVGSVQRPGDWPRFRWVDFDGWSLRIVQSKTGRALILPCTEHLNWQLQHSQRKGATILAGSDGQPLSYFTMARIMRNERQRLGLLDYDLHALRYRGVIELAWAGCSDDEIAAISGHTTTTMIRKYAGVARQEMRARSAAEKRRGV